MTSWRPWSARAAWSIRTPPPPPPRARRTDSQGRMDRHNDWLTTNGLRLVNVIRGHVSGRSAAR
jgi:hypothetical protein